MAAFIGSQVTGHCQQTITGYSSAGIPDQYQMTVYMHVTPSVADFKFYEGLQIQFMTVEAKLFRTLLPMVV